MALVDRGIWKWRPQFPILRRPIKFRSRHPSVSLSPFDEKWCVLVFPSLDSMKCKNIRNTQTSNRDSQRSYMELLEKKFLKVPRTPKSFPNTSLPLVNRFPVQKPVTCVVKMMYSPRSSLFFFALRQIVPHKQSGQTTPHYKSRKWRVTG